MGKFLWVLGGATLAASIYLVLINQEASMSVPADGMDNAEVKTGAWGTQQRGEGIGGQLKGKVEQGAGALTGDQELQDKGALDEAKGSVKNTAGKVAQAVSGAIHDLKK